MRGVRHHASMDCGALSADGIRFVMPGIAFRTEHLTRVFGAVRALDDLTLEVPVGTGQAIKYELDILESGKMKVTRLTPREPVKRPIRGARKR